MDILLPLCAGLDVHKDTVVACLRRVVKGKVEREVAAQADLREALRGRVTKHHRFLLRLHLRQIDTYDDAIAEIDREVDASIEPFRRAVELLSSIPGVSTLSAQVIIAEIGLDMSRFPSVRHLISWAGLCPKSDESAGKRRSTRMRKGAPWLKSNLIQCAWAAGRKKRSAVPSPARPARTEDGDWSRGGLDPDRRLPHAPERGVLSGPRPRALQPQGQGRASQAPRQALQNLGFAVEITPIAA